MQFVMKAIKICSYALLSGLLLVCACAKKSDVNTTKMEQSFASADPTSKSEADKAVASIKAGDYQTAIASLQKLASQAKLTPEQKDAVKDVIDQVQNKVQQAIKEAGKSTDKALDDAKKSLPK
jgi:Spy/CpxP family protein refolding chaperone